MADVVKAIPDICLVGRSRYAAEKLFKTVYNSHRCLISGAIKPMGGSP